jgi:hypothetical protein
MSASQTKTPATPSEIMHVIGGVAVAALIGAGIFASNIYIKRQEETRFESFANVCVSIPPFKYAKVIGMHYEPVFRGRKAFFHMVEINAEGKKFEVTEPARNIVGQPIVPCDPRFER